MKSNDILKETSKNSYFIKYMEECNKSKINHRKSNNNNSLRQSKTNYDPKENNISNSNQTNCSLTIHKKSKNNSVIKKTNNYSNKFNIHKKLTRTLSSIINPENSYKIYKDNNNKSSYISKSNNSFIKLKSNRKIFDKEVVLNNSLTTINENVNIPKIGNLSKKENAYLILSYSKCLRLCERMIFSRSTSKLREAINKKQMLEINKIYLIEKVKELEKKIENCDDKLKSKFNASKTAEMTLNYITSNFENDFRLNLFQSLEREEDKKYYYNYVKLLYLFLDENYNKVKNENLMKNLYQKIMSKGYKNIKDYLYYIYIKNLKENKTIEKINKINAILADTPDLLTFNHTIESNRFIAYSCYLFREIINYANEKIDTFKLKNDCINLVEVINNKLKLYKEKKI